MTHEFKERMRVGGRPFVCDAGMVPHVKQIFAGAYDIPGDWAPPGAVVLDLGANVGSFAVWAAKRWPGALVHSFEPHPETYGALLANMQGATGFRAYPLAVVGTGVGDLAICEGTNNSGEAMVVAADEAETRVQTIEARHLPAADVLKADIEGWELEVLREYPHWDRLRAVMYEFHREEDRLALDALMRLRGFALVGGRVFWKDLGEMKWLRREYVSRESGVPAGATL